MKHLIAPSFLSADFAHLQTDIEMINNSDADWFHLDVMDGTFVPNISFGIPVIKSIKKYSKKPLDVHLMIVEPDRYLSSFREAGADILTVHFEACTHLNRSVQAIKATGAKAGVALNPHTPVSFLEDIIEYLDLVLLMSVNPGFGGQRFIPNTFSKIEKLCRLITEKHSNALIEVDGGVDLQNANELIKSGVNVLVAGKTVFSSPKPVETIRQLKLG
jgi:ribulose-phosphate 3-epimerase